MNRFALFIFSIFLFSKVPLDANSCAFCNPEIIKKQSVLECQFFYILLDYCPRVFGHLLAIPKRHVVKAHKLSKDEWNELGDIIPKISKIFSEFLGTDDYIILEKNGENAFQNVPHVHFHLFPVHFETWPEIFNIIPDQLTEETLKERVELFQRYFDEASSLR